MDNKLSATIQIGDLLGVEAGDNSHGCQDYAVLRYDGSAWVVIEVQSCHSCWQVGHDQDHEFARIGDVINIPGEWTLDSRGYDSSFATDVRWEMSSGEFFRAQHPY